MYAEETRTNLFFVDLCVCLACQDQRQAMILAMAFDGIDRTGTRMPIWKKHCIQAHFMPKNHYHWIYYVHIYKPYHCHGWKRSRCAYSFFLLIIICSFSVSLFATTTTTFSLFRIPFVYTNSHITWTSLYLFVYSIDSTSLACWVFCLLLLLRV